MRLSSQGYADRSDPEPDDSAALARRRAEAQAGRDIEDAQAVADALSLLERAVRQLAYRSLEPFVARAARLLSMAKARLERVERRSL